uniref:Ig-like domain-containing protein n=1 Tax=Hucho hucho TaxID=62062 RepID=A0A4W5RQ69_9TELE
MEYQRTTMISLQRLSGLLMLMLLHGAPTTQGAMTTLPATAKQKENPESVSISVLSHSGPMVEGTKYQLQCDIQNIAPLQNLVVKWYKGNEPLDNVAYSNVSKTPENVSPTLMIIPGRDDDGAQYKCRAELDLGPEGPQPHPTVTSKPLTITVHCELAINLDLF